MSQKKVTICASIAFLDDISIWKEKLKNDGYDVVQYPKKLIGEFLPSYKVEFTEHYQKMAESDIVLILNMKKKGVDGYIGAAVFAEIAFAIGLNRTSRYDKKIDVYCLNHFPNSLPHAEELQYWVDLGWLKFWN
ncbi:MAG: hypothetical protein P4L62_00820 [Candidatus Pacebacteria bacterium]|nr:hypothetical protein [Candidatus Paceibacterota bacterium]